jgi:hypothetical protein
VGAANILTDTTWLFSRNENDSSGAITQSISLSRKQAARSAVPRQDFESVRRFAALDRAEFFKHVRKINSRNGNVCTLRSRIFELLLAAMLISS